MAIIEFVDGTYLRMMEHDKFLGSGGLTYKLDYLNHTNLLKISSEGCIKQE